MRSRSGGKPKVIVDRSPVKPILREDPIHTAIRVDELLAEIETLKGDRDRFIAEVNMERQKNRELEEEFHVLRGLIQETSKPIGYEENMVLKAQYMEERELRITIEADCNRIRQQLADTLAACHRDNLNLKKALSDMQQTNQSNLQTIYEKGDQNLQQMQQLEDLSKKIRDQESEINERDKII